MKKYLLLLLLAILTVSVSSAQDKKDRAKMMEELQQFKIDYIAKEMNLSEKEKYEFIPLYKEYDNERRMAGAETWKYERELKKNKNASEADYKKLSELQQKSREKDNEIVKKFDSKLENILSAKQIYIMHQAEGKFLEKMKDMHKKHPNGRNPHDKNKTRPSERKHKDREDSNNSPNPYDPMNIDL